MSVTREELLKAAEVVRRRAARQSVKEMTEEQLDASIRSHPIWSTIPNASLAGPISDEEIDAAIRNCQIAKALGIEIGG